MSTELVRGIATYISNATPRLTKSLSKMGELLASSLFLPNGLERVTLLGRFTVLGSR
jgi:hypothetical protein